MGPHHTTTTRLPLIQSLCHPLTRNTPSPAPAALEARPPNSRSRFVRTTGRDTSLPLRTPASTLCYPPLDNWVTRHQLAPHHASVLDSDPAQICRSRHTAQATPLVKVITSRSTSRPRSVEIDTRSKSPRPGRSLSQLRSRAALLRSPPPLLSASLPHHPNLAHGSTAASPVSPVFVRVHATGRRPGSFKTCSSHRSPSHPHDSVRTSVTHQHPVTSPVLPPAKVTSPVPPSVPSPSPSPTQHLTPAPALNQAQVHLTPAQHL